VWDYPIGCTRLFRFVNYFQGPASRLRPWAPGPHPQRLSQPDHSSHASSSPALFTFAHHLLYSHSPSLARCPSPMLVEVRVHERIYHDYITFFDQFCGTFGVHEYDFCEAVQALEHCCNAAVWDVPPSPVERLNNGFFHWERPLRTDYRSSSVYLMHPFII
jgi:hypothetical protein